MDREQCTAKAKTIINTSINSFLDAIKDKTSIGRKHLTYKSDFPIFRPANASYFEYKYFEDTLERNIRDYLVTEILCSLLSDNDISPDTRVLVQKKKTNKAYPSRYDNASFGEDYAFAFILQLKGQRIGCRYSGMFWNDTVLKEHLAINGLDRIEIIDWSDQESLDSKKNEYFIRNNQRDYVTYVTFHEFVAKYLSEDIYQYYLSSSREAVAKANDIIGFQTIPSLSMRYISDFKADCLNKMSKESIRNYKYHIFDTKGNLTDKNMDPLSDEDYDILDSRYFEGGLYKSLVGGEKFAKCFITSEYLYEIFKTRENVSFDYSAVATGYFKSVELLLDKIKEIWLYSPTIHSDLWIQAANTSKIRNEQWCRRNPDSKAHGAMQVMFRAEYKEYFKTEMGSLIWLLHDNKQGWNISNSRAIIHKCLLNYSRGCRNEHLHKDIIDDIEVPKSIEVLKSIRENTILCLYFLLGGCRMTGSISEDASALSLENDSYERLYKKIMEIPIKNYSIQFGKNNFIKAHRLYDQDQLTYDSSGKIISSIQFVIVDEFSDMRCDTYEEYLELASKKTKLVVSRQNMPERIWWQNRQKEFIEINW